MSDKELGEACPVCGLLVHKEQASPNCIWTKLDQEAADLIEPEDLSFLDDGQIVS